MFYFEKSRITFVSKSSPCASQWLLCSSCFLWSLLVMERSAASVRRSSVSKPTERGQHAGEDCRRRRRRRRKTWKRRRWSKRTSWEVSPLMREAEGSAVISCLTHGSPLPDCVTWPKTPVDMSRCLCAVFSAEKLSLIHISQNVQSLCSCFMNYFNGWSLGHLVIRPPSGRPPRCSGLIHFRRNNPHCPP